MINDIRELMNDIWDDRYCGMINIGENTYAED